MDEISKEKIEKIFDDFKDKIKKIKTTQDFEKIKIEFLGRKSQFNKIVKSIKDLSDDIRKEIGAFANEVKKEMTKELEVKKNKFSEKPDENSFDENWLDVTIPVREKKFGKLSILSQTKKEIEDIFTAMSFEIIDGPEIETEWYNFDALNVPADHPARDMQDTFWLKDKTNDDKAEKLLPRTQTSNMQIRYMEKHTPPFKVIAPGRVYRNEATDANHEHTFYQFEALVVGDGISVANFKDVAKKFFSAFFGKEVNIRLRPSYFPFTEPSFEFDISCTVCGGVGCKSCKNSGWLEVGGAGMVNQRVFEAVGYEKGKYQGFAWGFGIERLAMMKYKIDDIRLFKSGDLRVEVR